MRARRLQGPSFLAGNQVEREHDLELIAFDGLRLPARGTAAMTTVNSKGMMTENRGATCSPDLSTTELWCS